MKLYRDLKNHTVMHWYDYTSNFPYKNNLIRKKWSGWGYIFIKNYLERLLNTYENRFVISFHTSKLLNLIKKIIHCLKNYNKNIFSGHVHIKYATLWNLSQGNKYYFSKVMKTIAWINLLHWHM